MVMAPWQCSKKLKSLHCKSGTSLMLLCCKGHLSDPQIKKNKNDPKSEAHVCEIISMLNVKNKCCMNFLLGCE